MTQPEGFSWIEKPLLAALARPSAPEDFVWLRRQGIQLLISLTEDRPRKDWVEDASLLVFHIPVVDMEAPTQEELDRGVSAIERAMGQNLGVAVHCTAGLGRTGTMLAAYFIARGLSAKNAIARVRRLRPGSIETDEQEEAVTEFARRRAEPGQPE
jgi:atypical dual specificity phosphatase